MYSKCYPIITASFGAYGENQAPSDEKWRVFRRLNDYCYIMIRNASGEVEIAPLFIYSFSLKVPHHLFEAGDFELRFPDPSRITEIRDKLRYHRYKNALLQKDVADYIGIDRGTYATYEEPGRDYYPLQNMKKIAELFGVHVTELLDDYNMFLYNNQGKQIREKRLTLNMTQNEYAQILGVHLYNLKRWEQNKVRIFKSTWKRFFK